MSATTDGAPVHVFTEDGYRDAERDRLRVELANAETAGSDDAEVLRADLRAVDERLGARSHLADIVCPRCETPIGRRLSVVLESVRRAARQPVTPEILLVCGGCGHMYVAALREVIA